jgi:hypothetical protein
VHHTLTFIVVGVCGLWGLLKGDRKDVLFAEGAVGMLVVRDKTMISLPDLLPGISFAP